MLWIKKKKRTVKSKPKTKTESKSKSESKKTHAKNITKFIDPAFRLVLKSIVDSFSKTYSSEDVIKALKILEFEIFKYKEQTISALTELPSISDREKIWDKVKELFVEILLPMITIMNTNIASNLTKNKEEKEEKDEDIPLEIPNIGIVSRQSAKDVATVKSRLIAPNSEKTLVHTITIVDTGSDTSLVSKNIVKRLDMEIDNTNAPKLSGVATKTETIGTVYGFSISIYDDENSRTIEDDFMVINTDKDFVLLGIPWIDRAKAIVDFNSRILQIPISQRKSIIVPISLHRKKTNVTSLNIDKFELCESNKIKKK